MKRLLLWLVRQWCEPDPREARAAVPEPPTQCDWHECQVAIAQAGERVRILILASSGRPVWEANLSPDEAGAIGDRCLVFAARARMAEAGLTRDAVLK
jgi:hypothetical protein